MRLFGRFCLDKDYYQGLEIFYWSESYFSIIFAWFKSGSDIERWKEEI